MSHNMIQGGNGFVKLVENDVLDHHHREEVVHQQQPAVIYKTSPYAPPAVTAQPIGKPLHHQLQPPVHDWSTSLTDCHKDWGSCFLSVFFTSCYGCCLASRMRENLCTPIFGGGTPVMMSVLRARHGIKGTIQKDCCTALFCHPCAMAQLSRELDNLGYPDEGCC